VPQGFRACVCVLGAVLALGPAASAHAATSDVEGKSTVAQRIVGGDPTQGFQLLGLGAGEGYVTRNELAAPAAGRDGRRRSLLYFGQLTDFQLADEESPARVEALDLSSTPFTSAWRPQEALGPQVVDRSIRQMNRFAAASPIAQAGGSRARMRFVLTTGDSADSQQLNETEWVVRLLEGGLLDPNSGSANPADYAGACPAALTGGPAEAARYTGVQDANDVAESTDFYYPDAPLATGPYARFPRYPGLLDRAQQPFQAEGLQVPSYVSLGNHDGLVQGNQAANSGIEGVATGCLKPLQTGLDLRNSLTSNPSFLASLLTTNPTQVSLVPPDPRRRFVSKREYRSLHDTRRQADAHGFGFVDPAEAAASNGAASYYAWSPSPGFRFIALDTVCDGGLSGPSAEGNLDDPQLRWIERQVRAASARDELVVMFGHHPIRSLSCTVPDEAAPACTGPDGHGHDVNPGCDSDPRNSGPVHTGADLVGLAHRYPHVIGLVFGHTHVNTVTPFPRRGGGGFWGIETASEADWPQQSRLIDVMDNRDGSLSLFGTVLDQAAPTGVPGAGTPAAGFDTNDLAAIGRTLAYNDPQNGPTTGTGLARDRNVELLLRDPRLSTGSAVGAPGAGCRDRLRPVSRTFRVGSRVTRTRIHLAGASRDRHCGPLAPAADRFRGRVARVFVALGQEVPGGCRFLTPRGRLSPRRDCRRASYLGARVRYSARGRQSLWSLDRRVRLPRGRFLVTVRGRDPLGNLELRHRTRALARLSAR